MSITLTVHDEANPELREVILVGLRAYNETRVGAPNIRPVIIALRDAAHKPVGGLTAHTAFSWMFIELLHVPENMRGAGAGRALMQKAEEIARLRGCTGIWLDTFSFQARGFYEKQGFAVFGQLDNYPKGETRFFMQKRL